MRQQTLHFWNYCPKDKIMPADSFCTAPYVSMVIDEDLDVMLCGCPGHNPYVIGNVGDHNLFDIWHGALASDVRTSVWQGKYTYCSQSCPGLLNLEKRPDQEPRLELIDMISINLGIDRSCNLKCASCREQMIIEKNPETIEKFNRVINDIICYAADHPLINIIVNPSGSGEPFASWPTRKLIKDIVEQDIKNISLAIQTNGTLIPQNWDLIKRVLDRISRITWSIDAASSTVYSKVRGGDWSAVLKGIELVRQADASKLGDARFVLQKSNYHQLEDFCDLFLDKGMHVIHVQKMGNWGHWDPQWWADHDIVDINRPEFPRIAEMITRIKAKHGWKVGFDNDIEITYNGYLDPEKRLQSVETYAKINNLIRRTHG